MRVRGRQKTTNVKAGEVRRKWWLVDASGGTLGRLATRIAVILQGKHKPEYTPYIDTGDHVVVTNAGKVAVTGKKLDQKEYQKYTGYLGGLKRVPMRRLLARRPELVIELAVKRMLPKGILGRKMIKKLKVYAGPSHPHEAQRPEALSF